MSLRSSLGDLNSPRAVARRLAGSAVLWSWVFNGLRLASGLILLPLVLRYLPVADLGMYYVFLSQVALVTLVDFGFAPTAGRFISYAMAGAPRLEAFGVPKGGTGTPNYSLLWELLFTMQRLYRYLTLFLVVILAVYGTWVVEIGVKETSSVPHTRLAWAVTILGASLDIYSGWWMSYLRSLNKVVEATRLSVVATLVRVVLAAGLLVGGAGLLSLPVATCLSSLLQRWFARTQCMQFLAGHASPGHVNVRDYLRILWPNTWRLGIGFVGRYLVINVSTAMCLLYFGLKANATYGLSVQIVNIIGGMTAVWTSVKWPLVGQLCARHDDKGILRMLWPRIWLQNLTFAAAAGFALLIGPWIIGHFSTDKSLLPVPWLGLLLLTAFFDMHFTIWSTLLSTQNRLPFLWPLLATNVVSLVLSFLLIKTTSLGLGSLVLGPLLAGCAFNYWYWPHYTTMSLGVGWAKFTFRKPEN